MTVPPNQPQRPTDELPPTNTSPPAHPVPDTAHAAIGPEQPASDATPTHEPPAPATSTSPPATTYLSGILTAGLAAICGAIFTSWAGVQGTLVGAMIGATIGSSVSEIVRAPLDTLERRLVAAGFSRRQLRQDGVVKTVATSPAAAQQAFGLISKPAIVTIGATAIVGFLLAVGGVTAVEVAAGEPLAAMVSDQPATGTTVGNALPNAPAALAPAPANPGAPSASSSGSAGGGVTGNRPADPILGAEDPDVPARSSPTADGAAANDRENTNSAASPVPAASPDATEQAVAAASATPTATSSAMPTPTRTGSGTATATASTGPSAVQVVTVVVTATPASQPSGAAPNAAAATASPPAAQSAATVIVQTATATSTPSPTSTPTPTSTTTPTRPSS